MAMAVPPRGRLRRTVILWSLNLIVSSLRYFVTWFPLSLSLQVFLLSLYCMIQ